MIYDGRNGGTVELLDDALVIRRKGVTGFLTQGLKGEKRIPFSSITSVQFKEPGVTTGYIQFGIIGGIESRGGVFNATTDENTVLFLKKALEEFRQLRDIVQGRIGQPSRTVSAPTMSAVNFSEELTRLADLHDRGALTEEEFAEEKARLQGSRKSTVPPAPSKADVHIPPARLSNQEILAQTAEVPKRTGARKMGVGCLVVIGVLVGLSVLGAIAGSDKNKTSVSNAMTPLVQEQSNNAETSTVEPEHENLTPSQRNAARSAEQYLNMSGFSQRGLVQQLSSDAGEGYSVADATAAVDSLTVDWNENAARSARQYVEMSGFSCKGLIQQLSSSAGEKYTVAQATYGARQAGAC